MLAKTSTRKSCGSFCIDSFQVCWFTRQKIWGKLGITKTRRVPTDKEFGVSSTSWRLTVPSEFQFNKLILKFCPLVNGLYIWGRASYLPRFISKVIFFCFSKQINIFQPFLKFTSKQFSQLRFLSFVWNTLKLPSKRAVLNESGFNQGKC